jgi:hypothetical protein
LEEKLPKEAIIQLFDSQNDIMALDASSAQPAHVVELMAKNFDKPADIESLNANFLKRRTMYLILKT